MNDRGDVPTNAEIPAPGSAWTGLGVEVDLR
jgi:hypothetical protein